MGDIDLDEVLRRACRRDPDALAVLVDAYSPRVYGLVYRLSGSREAAEDLLQETFLRVVRTIGSYEHSGKFEAWLFRIAANVARDRARHGRRRGQAASLGDRMNVDAGAAGEYAAAGFDPQRRLMNKESGELLERSLQRLTEPEREILLLRHYSGLPFPEIARILGVPLGTALARAHRALARLRSELSGPD